MASAPALVPGIRIARYQLVALLGRGGAGEVWRARDIRLGRDVALKVLRGEGGADVLAAIEREARVVASLFHPNLVTVLELDTASSPPFLAMELVEGRTLAALVADGPLPPARALDLAAQIADGLAAAHGAGLVHRDLKPGNVVVSRSGAVKILDFGLARRESPAVASPSDVTLPEVPATAPGTLVGTVAYMSPEQAAGRPAGPRADQFALGLLLYELLAGRRAFARPTGVECLAAILREAPEPLPELAPALDAPVRAVLERCLAKEPSERYPSTGELAAELRRLARAAAGAEPVASAPAPTHPPRPSRPAATRLRAGAAIAAATLVGLALWSGMVRHRQRLPAFQQLTFRRGTVWCARFTPGGDGVVYGASWDGSSARPFTARVEGGPSTVIGTRDASLLAVSGAGEAALSLDARPELVAGMMVGILARVPLSGGAPREVLEAVEFADFVPPGSDLVTVRRREGRARLEAPHGRVLYETTGWISHPRVSRDGRDVAFLHHPALPDDRGEVVLVSLASGTPRVLSPGWISALGLAWSADGREVWFTATGSGGGRALHGVDRAGRLRTIYRSPGNLTLHDVSTAGRVLVSHDTMRVGLMRGREGEPETEASWLDSSLLTDLSSDGRTMLFSEFGEGGGPLYSVLLRRADGGLATRLGDGFATSLSLDGKRVLSILPKDPPELVVLPTGPGEPERVVTDPVLAVEWATWLPAGGGMLLVGSARGGGPQLWRLDRGGPARRLAADPVASRFAGAVVSPDGRRVAAATADGGVLLCPADGTPATRLGGAARDLVPVRWGTDGRSLLAFALDGPYAQLVRVDTSTGAARPVRDLRPVDPAGVIGIPTVRTSADGTTWLYSYARLLSELYLVDGLR